MSESTAVESQLGLSILVIGIIAVPLAALFALTRPAAKNSRGKFHKVRGKKTSLPDLWAVPTMRKSSSKKGKRSANNDDDDDDDHENDDEDDATEEEDNDEVEDDEGEESEVHTDDEEESQGEEDDEVERGGGRRRAQERKATAANPVKFALTFKEPKDRAT